MKSKKFKKNKEIKITYLVDFFRTINAGTERQLGHLLTHLPKFGYSVQLISFQDSPFLREEAPLLFQKVRIKTLGGKSDISQSFSALAQLFFLMCKNTPDIVHTFLPASNSFGILISRLAGVRILISSRRDMGYNLTRKDLSLLKIANLFVSSIVTNSRAVQKRTIQLEGIPISKTRVIYNGIPLQNLTQLPERRTTKEAIVGIVANMNRAVKRVDLFIKAAALVHKNLPAVKFLVIGEGKLRPNLERLASNLGLNSNVVFMGRREDVKELLSKMIVGVISSDSEGFSNSIMEYMGAGLPVIATDVGGNSELVHHGKTGFLVPPNDADALGEALQNLLNDPDLACRMGDAGFEFINREFRIERMIQKTRDLYESLLD